MAQDIVVRGLSSKSVWDYENGFYWFSDPKRLGKLVAHYELYNRILSLPGHVVEFGVYKATSLLRLATFRSFLESPDSRGIYGFDAFGPFPTDNVNAGSDQAFIKAFESAGGEGLSTEEVMDLLKLKQLERNVHLVKGDVTKTAPEFLKIHPEFRVALLHLDLDVYEPTKLALKHFWPRVVRGGLLVVDDYNAVGGATAAIDEFLADNPELRLQKLGCTHIPSYLAKP